MVLSRSEKIEKLRNKSNPNKDQTQWKTIAEWNRKHSESIEDMMIIAARILSALKDQCMSQKDLAERLGVKPQALTRIVKGRQNLTLQTIRRIEQVLDISLISVHSSDESLTQGKNPIRAC